MKESSLATQAHSQLWSIQREAAYEELQRTGVLRANAEYIEPDFIPAYAWMTAQLEKKTPKPPGCPARYPMWAWIQYKNRINKAPKPSDQGLLPAGAKGVILQLALSPRAFLASDFQKWHAVLNQEYLPKDNSDQQAFETWAKTCRQQGHVATLIEHRIKSSWHRVFDIDEAGSDCWEAPEDREIQAVLWQIDREFVVSAEPFIAT